MTQEAIDAEIARCNRLLAAREGKTGYSVNVEAIKARIAELQEMTPDNG